MKQIAICDDSEIERQIFSEMLKEYWSCRLYTSGSDPSSKGSVFYGVAGGVRCRAGSIW